MADAVRWVQYATYLPTIIVSLPLNLAALWMLFFKIRRFTESTVYLTNLVINDCLLLFSLPFKIYAYDTEWNLSSTFCSFLESLVYVNIYGSIGLIVCISMDRYVALKYPFQMTRLRSPRKAAVICLFIWITIFGVVLILQKMRRRNPLDKKLRNNKSVKIVLSNLITFLVCFIPYHVAALLYFLAKKQVITGFNGRLRDFVHISSCLSSVNCLFDGVCYYFILKENEQSVKQERWHLFSVTQRSILRNEGPKTQESAENLSTGVSKTQNTACP
ncbi:G-protein coupled receptor 55a isoform X2 [Scleropages formosus]|uniref:G-protein coupled receptor 55a isoform X2 n=1 Tax=Scleropages formosus TaxID=113540 RepID=UPI00087848CC|nr:G-protein coupled receptor 55-like isoform X2 [Scleropages formosus]